MSGTVAVRNNPEESCYQLIAWGGVAGRVTYHHRDGIMTLDHTGIDDSFAGHGYGTALAQGVFEDLREQGTAVRIDCPFLGRWLAKHPEFADLVVAPDR